MSDLPEKIVQFDMLRVEYGTRKLCHCDEPCYQIDYANRLVRCTKCNAIVEPFEALYMLAKQYRRIEDVYNRLFEQRRQIMDYHPRRVILKELEKRFVRAEHDGLEPTCPCCGRAFELRKLLEVNWVNPAFAKRLEGERKNDDSSGHSD